MPGLKMLPLSVAPPKELFWLPRICSIVTTIGVHWTFGFQEVSWENTGTDPTVSNPKFRLYGDVVPSIHMMPNEFLPFTDAE
jgi:hypothetical protein